MNSSEEIDNRGNNQQTSPEFDIINLPATFNLTAEHENAPSTQEQFSGAAEQFHSGSFLNKKAPIGLFLKESK